MAAVRVETWQTGTKFILDKDIMIQEHTRISGRYRYFMTRDELWKGFSRLENGERTAEVPYHISGDRNSYSCAFVRTRLSGGMFLYIGCQGFDMVNAAKLRTWASGEVKKKAKTRSKQNGAINKRSRPAKRRR